MAKKTTAKELEAPAPIHPTPAPPGDRAERILRAAKDGEPLDPGELADLRTMLAAPEMRDIYGLARSAMTSAIAALAGPDVLQREMTHAEVNALKAELGFDTALALERLIIEQVAMCWLRMWQLETDHTIRARAGMHIEQAAFQQRQLTQVQGRYLRALESLARVRRLKLPALQVNMAAAGAKQLNVTQS